MLHTREFLAKNFGSIIAIWVRASDSQAFNGRSPARGVGQIQSPTPDMLARHRAHCDASLFARKRTIGTHSIRGDVDSADLLDWCVGAAG